MKKINYQTASFKDFENIPDMDCYGWADEFSNYTKDWASRGHWNYAHESFNGSFPEVEMRIAGNPHQRFVGMVFNDYLGFTQHPMVKAAAIAGIEKYGTGAAASPAIGGYCTYHRQIEEKIASFFNRDAAMVFTTGYTSNSATFQALLKEGDLAIVDMGVHASVLEGCQLASKKTFPHNDMDALERVLINSKDKYRTRMVIIDGVYSQQADIARLDQIVKLCKHYGAYIAMDDAHGVGVLGKSGRGVIELYDLYQEVDIITGVFSKTFAHLGGYVIASPKLINFLKFQARQYIFSVTATPASLCILKSIDLIDEEPFWRDKLWRNVNRLTTGLKDMGFDIGNTQSAIVPVMTGDPAYNAEVCRLLQDAGVYANQIGYPAVPRNNARIRMSVMATHSDENIDRVLSGWEWVDSQMHITKKDGYAQEAI